MFLDKQDFVNQTFALLIKFVDIKMTQFHIHIWENLGNFREVNIYINYNNIKCP